MATLALSARAENVAYTYDALGRLKAVAYTTGSSVKTITYAYDAAGNRTQVSVTSGNQSPVAVDDSKWTPLNTGASFDPRTNDTDPDSDPLSVVSVGVASHGTVSSTSTSVTYTPATGYSGSDSFTYTISDGQGATDNGLITMTVGGGNQPPVATNDAKTTQKNTALTFDPRTNDSDPNNDLLTISATTNGAHGTVAIVGGTQVTFTPASNYVGTDSFTYTISDGNGGTAVGTVQMTVVAGPEPPNAVDDYEEIILPPAGLQSLIMFVLYNDTDPNNDPLTIIAVSTPTNSASAAISGDRISVTGIRVGTTTFTYTISDGNGGTDTATATIVRTVDLGDNNLMTAPEADSSVEEVGQ